jgi:hypothetical protein
VPIVFDKRPGSIKHHQRRRDGTFTKDYVPEPEPVIAPAPTMRIRILRNIIHSRSGTFLAGQTTHLPIDKARLWIEAGLAEEDKSLDGPPETKS